MINIKFGLWWSGSKLSYLRYLTFKSLRHFHPNAEIQLYIGTKFKNDGYNWNNESFGLRQEFQNNNDIKKDYTDKLIDLDINIIKVDLFRQYQPTFQSDFFRWWWLKRNGGFYLDTDQIILKPFDNLPLNNKIIYCRYLNYSPVGVIGSQKDSEIVNKINNVLPLHYDPNNYNSCGPYMFSRVFESQKWHEGFNAPQIWFYPCPISNMVKHIYNGNIKLTPKSYAIHLFGGHPTTQAFNRIYTEELSKTNDDTISRFLRKNKII